jgi:hypothetical protein
MCSKPIGARGARFIEGLSGGTKHVSLDARNGERVIGDSPPQKTNNQPLRPAVTTVL